MVTKLLLISGILTAIAVTVRHAVVLGLYLGVLPGLILLVAPTVFLYTAAFALVRRALPPAGDLATNGAALVLTLALGFAVAAPGWLAGRAAFARILKPDVSPAAPVKLFGDVLLERSKLSDGCDALCAALLDTPSVTSVTLRTPGEDRPGVTYRLEPRTSARGSSLKPDQPERIVEHLPRPERPGLGGPGPLDAVAARKALEDGVVLKWALRLATEAQLVAAPPLERFDTVVAILETTGSGPHRITLTELEVRDGGSKVLLRRQRVAAEPIGAPLTLYPHGPMMDRGWGPGRASLRSGPRYPELKPIQSLFEGTTLARPEPPGTRSAEIRARLADAVTGAGAAEDLALTPWWLATLDWSTLAEQDVDLLAALLANPRTPGLERLYYGYASQVSPKLRPAVAQRLLDPRITPQMRSTLNDLARNMPAGTYRELLPDEDRLLGDRDLRLRSSALVARLADQGRPATTRLVALLEDSSRVPSWAARQWILQDLRQAFLTLGPEAAEALPAVEALFAAEGSPLTNSSGDVQDWGVALVRMGRSVETLRFPTRFRPEVVQNYRESIARTAARLQDTPAQPS